MAHYPIILFFFSQSGVVNSKGNPWQGIKYTDVGKIRNFWWMSCYILETVQEKKERKKVKEADLYSAFIEVPYTQGAQVRITQCYLQIAPYLPLPRKHSSDGASQTEVADI